MPDQQMTDNDGQAPAATDGVVAALLHKDAQPDQQRGVATADPTDRDLGREDERGRVDTILHATRCANLSMEFAQKLIADRTVTAEMAQRRVLEELRKRGGPPTGGPVISEGRQEVDTILEGVKNAILHRIAPQHFKLDDNGRQYRGTTLMEMARVCLHARGFQTLGLSKLDLAGGALGNLNLRGPSGYHTTSDFPLLLADVANKSLRRAYEQAPQTFTGFSRRITLPDFKPSNRLTFGDAPGLLQVREHGEFTRGSVAEAREQFSLATYGRVFAITRQSLINDDTDAFSRMTAMFGRQARELESNLVWAQITGNPVMGDGVTLFHANHGNQAGSAGAISITTLGAARQAMRSQRGLAAVGETATFINVNPRYLVVPTALETIADQHVTQITPALSGSVNPFQGRLQVIAEPRLDASSATVWYVFASADDGVDVIEYAYLEGEEGPQTETRTGFDVDGVEIKCRHDFAAKVIDWKGVYRNS